MRIRSVLAAMAVAMGLAGAARGQAVTEPEAKSGAKPGPAEKVCAVYTTMLEFDGPAAREAAIASRPAFLLEKHKRMLGQAGESVAERGRRLREAGFNTVFLTLYPVHGRDWWAIPAARGLVKDALLNAHAAGLHVHVGISIFNANFCADPARFPGASRTIQCDGTRPSWICFHDDRLWDYYIRNFVELAKLGQENPSTLDGVFIDPEAYGPECYLCFCDNCVRKFDAWSGEKMPAGLVKPDAWLLERGLWAKYAVAWDDQEVTRHAAALRDAVHAVDPKLQLSSLLWDYPVAVGANDARQAFYHQLAIGLGTPGKPSWTMPEHTYYSDAEDLARILRQMNQEIAAAGAAESVRVLPGVRLVRRTAASLVPRGKVIGESQAAGYWLYELADLEGKEVVDFEGGLIDSPEAYWKALAGMNAAAKGK